MTTALFNEWITDFNRKMRLQNRNVLLFIDNAPSHPAQQLSNVKVQFLPPNTTSVLQPLDAGLIKTMKSNYRKCLLRAVLSRIDQNLTVSEIQKQISVLDAYHWIATAVRSIQGVSVLKCFNRCGIYECVQEDDQPLPESDQSPPADDQSPPEDMQFDPEDGELVDLIDQYSTRSGSNTCSANDYANYDSSVLTSEDMSPGWEERQLQDIVTANNGEANVDSDNDDSDHVPSPTLAEVLHNIENIKVFCAEKNLDILPDVMNVQMKLQSIAVRSKCNAKQSSIRSYFTTDT